MSLQLNVPCPRIPESWNPRKQPPRIVGDKDAVDLAIEIAEMALDAAEQRRGAPRTVQSLRSILRQLRDSLRDRRRGGV